MLKLSIATAKGRRNTAGCIRLAVFFLFCLFGFSSCPANASDNDGTRFPFVKNGGLYAFSAEADELAFEESFDTLGSNNGFIQKGVSVSQKSGWIIAWNKNNQTVYHIDENKKVRSKVNAGGALAYVDKNYILTQTSSFNDNKGFGFTLYSIKYTRNEKKISLKTVWSGYADCFVSDCFFTADGVCISGGTRDDTKNNAFYITAKGIHKCFSTAKNSDFLRLLNAGDKVYAFLSGREKTVVEPLLYSFTLNDYIEGDSAAQNLSEMLPADFECFFGYGFVMKTEAFEALVIPASFNGVISFVCYDYKNANIKSIIPDAVGCMSPLGTTADGVWYIARDALIEDSWYGISLFDGISCKKIQKIY